MAVRRSNESPKSLRAVCGLPAFVLVEGRIFQVLYIERDAITERYHQN